MFKIKKINKTAEIIKTIADPIAQQLGLEVWEVKFIKEGPNWILRVLIDKNGGITIEDCEKMSKALDAPLDELDPISQAYCLEVSSPGIERELTCDYHLKKFLGSSVKIKLLKSRENILKTIEGQLLNFNENTISIKNSLHKITVLPRKNILQINLNLIKERQL